MLAVPVPVLIQLHIHSACISVLCFLDFDEAIQCGADAVSYTHLDVYKRQVYEAAPDALAHMTLEGGRADKYRLSLGGIYVPRDTSTDRPAKSPAALEAFLQNHPEVDALEPVSYTHLRHAVPVRTVR